MLPNTTQIYITDKNDKRHFNTLCSTAYASSERRNLERHIAQAKATPDRYSFLDVATMRIVQFDAEPVLNMTDDEILSALLDTESPKGLNAVVKECGLNAVLK